GGSFTGKNYGVAGCAYGSTATESAGGYFKDSISPSQITEAIVAGYNGGTEQKILGTGNVSTIVKDTKGNQVVMFAPEAPEILFEDYGHGKLNNGKVHIELDPIFVKNVAINDKHP